MNEVEAYDGTSWSAKASLSTDRRSGAAGGQTPSAATIFFGGRDGGSDQSITEEFTQSANVVTAATWSSTPSLGTARYTLAGSGTETATLASGGGTTTTVYGQTEEFDGSSWSEQNDLSTARRQIAGAGLQTAAFICGGKLQPNNDARTDTEHYNGSSWTGGGTMSNARRLHSALGTQTAGLAVAGFAPPATTTCEDYNGSSWTSAGGLTGSARYRNASCGVLTAGLVCGGADAPGSAITLTEEYNGSSWTAGGALNQPTNHAAVSGVQTSVIVFGNNASSESYNGTSWATSPGLGTLRNALGGSNNSASNSVGLAFGGNPPISSASEEFTGETTALNVKQILSS